VHALSTKTKVTWGIMNRRYGFVVYDENFKKIMKLLG
jgi:hypothetical protein